MASRKVLLVGWDAADWKVIHPLIEAGKMPNLQRLVEQGASGQIATLHPPLSPMLWTSIATGKRPFKHGILGFSEPTPDGRGVRAVTNLSRKSKAIWNILNQNDLRSIVVGWWPSHPAEPINGVMVSDHFHRARGPIDQGWPLIAHTVHPPHLASKLADLRVHPDCLTPRDVEPFVPQAEQIDQDKDKRLSLVLRTIAECKSIHSAASWLLDNQPWDFFAVYFDAIDHFCHGFMRYHPPRQNWISEQDFELYQHVVSAAYQLHDQMLGALIEKAGGATVILLSDHGFHPDHLRPASIPDIPAGPAIEHRELGILCISGPGIRKNDLLHGASVLDIAPTVLTLFGLPVGADMDGKLLVEPFAEKPKLAFIPSWEDIPGADGSLPPDMRLDPVAAHDALERMIALGYVERPDENREVRIAKTIRELRYNLGEAYQDAGRHWEAREIFSELWTSDRNEQRFAVRLFASCQALGRLDEMKQIVDSLAERGHYQTAIADLLGAQLLIAEKRFEEASKTLEQITDAHGARPELLAPTADVYLRLGRWREAQRVFHNILALNPDHSQAHIGLCKVALRQKRFDVAVQSALNAIERFHHDPEAHFLLGVALAAKKDYARSAEAFRTAILLNPHFPEAHARLASLLGKRFRDAEAAHEHRLLAKQMRRRAGRITWAMVKEPRALPPPCVGPRANWQILPLKDSLIVVTGLPRSGTSMVMQMLAAGGVSILSDNVRESDEDNPRGYFEFEPVKKLFNDAGWLTNAQGKAVKIIAPLLTALPASLACRVILCERNLDAVLDSQERMLLRRKQPATTPERRRILENEYKHALERVKGLLARRPNTELLVIGYSEAICNPFAVARRINEFLGDGLDVSKMAAAIEPELSRSGSVTRAASKV